MAAGLTLAILVLPIVIITSAEAIRAVPESIREAGFGVGATRWEVIRSHVLPVRRPGHPHRHRAVPGPGAGRGRPAASLVGAKTGFFGGGEFGDLTGSFTALPSRSTSWAKLPDDKWGASTARRHPRAAGRRPR